ncbi:P-loop containing nucleoside triphosphate hydrolase protein [Byssothecium circinans]|uniref:P-loop containing nucleoside triphosphate hydrolase protein n=1 Tax=Byssothecium circinans TaxID=147558 RepID=A0A6A5T9Q2_9PLEO|nr:P-loop containing nucleoside triphosphate hydrolase protein [Byssothecium circinans]
MDHDAIERDNDKPRKQFNILTLDRVSGEIDKYGAQACSDLKELLRVVSKETDERVVRFFKSRNKATTDRTIAFEYLWTLFRAGDIVFGRPFQGQPQLFVVSHAETSWPWKNNRGNWNEWKLTVWMYDWDGHHFSRRFHEISFGSFDGGKQISVLPFYPIRYHENKQAIQNELLDRGRSQLTPQDDDDSSSVMNEQHSRRASKISRPLRSSDVNSQVMVDFHSYTRYGPETIQLGELIPLEGDFHCRCDECTENKELEKFHRGRYDDDNGNMTSFDKVRLAKDYTKDVLLDLVKHHGSGSGKGRIRDIVLDMGNSLVILLYGPPGVGKTSTAETIAIATKKPLFSVSVSDVGTKAQFVERNLDKVFDLAAQWEAILLIGFNTERNALVSGNATSISVKPATDELTVFLRVLEYYQGELLYSKSCILFLTTNQIAQFDVAVQSRIHIALKYDQLDDEQTEAIFKQFLVQLESEGQVKDMGEIMTWVRSEVIRRKYSFDGRQIRNVISCAMTLARAHGKKLSKDQIMDVVDFVREFKTEFQLQFDRYLSSQAGRDNTNN